MNEQDNLRYFKGSVKDNLTKSKKRVVKLLIRDGHNCWLCKQPFSRKSGRKPSLDHVVPLSKGGSNSLDNIKLAHSRCNYYRGNDDPPKASPAIPTSIPQVELEPSI